MWIAMFKRVSFLFVIIVFFFNTGSSASGTDFSTAVDLLKKYHCKNVEFDSSAVDDVKKEFIQELDGGGLFFYRADIKGLLSVPLSSSDLPFTTNRNQFYQKALQLFKTRLNETLHIIDDICMKRPDYNEGGSVRKLSGKPEYSADDRERKNKWSGMIRFQILAGVYEKSSDEPAPRPFKDCFEQYEASVRADVLKRCKQRVNAFLRYPEGYETFVGQMYINSIASRFDPHSAFFPASFMKRFVSGLSSQTQSFGFAFRRNRAGEMVVEKIVPGGPAWKSGMLSNGDSITGVSSSQEGSRSNMTDLSGRSYNEVYDLINGSSNSVVLQVKKKNGKTVRCRLVKQKMSGDNRIMTSYILDGKKKVGYISLPAFYTDWDTPGQLGCANDVAREILKLQRDGIEGLVLDLRDNSGGSVAEALSLAGLFIDEGPMAFAVKRGDSPVMLKDPSRGTVYDGPLAVLINSQSASASELTASILKDYNRAVIAGSPSYGKASMQEVLPVKKLMLSDPGKASFGGIDGDFIMITVSVNYSAGGGTYQKTGVIPHVEIPELTEWAADQEKDLPFCLGPVAVSRTASIEKGDGSVFGSLASKSRSRVKKSDRFEALIRIKEEKTAAETMWCPLSIEGFPSEFKKIISAGQDSYKKAFVKTGNYGARLNSQDAELVLLDSYMREISREKIVSLDEDPVLDETYRVVLDYINSTK
jgi:carboxyl-terminal processing protease